MATAGALAIVTILAALEYLHFSTQVSSWYLMSDELLWQRLGLSIFETGSPAPSVRGLPVGAYSGLYPLLTSPAYARDDMQDAFRAVHQINAVLMASAAIPAYLLARQVLASRLAALLASALTVAVPWAVLTLLIMSESAAYPAFLWALFAMHRAMLRRSVGADALALGAIAVAMYSRSQFVVLAPALVCAVVLHEVAMARATDPKTSWGASLAQPARLHPLLAAATLLGLLAFVALLATGRAGAPLGGYATAAEGPLPPWDELVVAARRVTAWITLDTAVLPVVAGGAWLLVTVLRPRAPRAAHAFAALSLCVVAALGATVVIFIAKFAGADRYLFYIAPIFFIAMLAALSGTGGRLPLAAIAVTLAVTVWAFGYLVFPGALVGAHASPGETAYLVFAWWPRRIASAVGVDGAGHLWALYAAAGGAAIAAIALSRLADARAALVAGVAVLVFGAALTHYAFGKMLAYQSGPPPPQTVADQDWIDESVPADASVGLLPSHFVDWFYSARVWWDVEFWNRTVDRVYSVAAADTYTALPRQSLAFDPDSGVVRASDETDFVVMTSEAAAFRPRGELVASSPEPVLEGQDVHLDLWRVERPMRAAWTITNIDEVHYFRAGRPARVRVFGGTAPEGVILQAGIQFAQDTPARRRWFVRSGGLERRGSIGALGVRTIETELCLPPDGFRDVQLGVGGPPRADIAQDSLRLVSMKLVPSPGACSD
jgi:hypothetical protein